jgi:hypothetical protein
MYEDLKAALAELEMAEDSLSHANTMDAAGRFADCQSRVAAAFDAVQRSFSATFQEKATMLSDAQFEELKAMLAPVRDCAVIALADMQRHTALGATPPVQNFEPTNTELTEQKPEAPSPAEEEPVAEEPAP